MYNKQFDLPIRIRTPMGGGRGYGPTHSQSLEKYLCGIDNLAVVALTSLDNPNSTLSALHDYRSPFIIIELLSSKIFFNSPTGLIIGRTEF